MPLSITSGNHKADCFLYEFVLDATYKWDHAVFIFLCLAYFT